MMFGYVSFFRFCFFFNPVEEFVFDCMKIDDKDEMTQVLLFVQLPTCAVFFFMYAVKSMSV